MIRETTVCDRCSATINTHGDQWWEVTIRAGAGGLGPIIKHFCHQCIPAVSNEMGGYR